MDFGKFKPDEHYVEQIMEQSIEHNVFDMKNGYRVSVIRGGRYTHGGRAGLWELAVMDDEDHDIVATPLTKGSRDVIGYLSEADVERALEAVEALPARKRRRRKR